MAGRPVIRPGLGVVAISVTPQVAFANDLGVERGVLVLEVDEGPAAAAGIRAGDIITSVGGQLVQDLHAFHILLWRRRPGDALDVGVERNGTNLTVRAFLARACETCGTGAGP